MATKKKKTVTKKAVKKSSVGRAAKKASAKKTSKKSSVGRVAKKSSTKQADLTADRAAEGSLSSQSAQIGGMAAARSGGAQRPSRSKALFSIPPTVKQTRPTYSGEMIASEEETESRNKGAIGRVVILAILAVVVIALAVWSTLSNEQAPEEEQVPETPVKQEIRAKDQPPVGEKEKTAPLETKEQQAVDDTAAPQPTYRYYTVTPGDTLHNIASKTLGNPERVQEIMKLNGLTGSNIKEGQQLKLPAK